MEQETQKKGKKMTSKQMLNGLYGMIATSGLVLLMCCDTETVWQLFFVVIVGLALMVFGGRGLILNDRSENMNVKKHLDLLGHEVKDKVSDFKGVVISMSFDLYGCIQADVRAKELDKDGKMKNGMWLDVSRLEVLSKKPLMEQPNFDYGIAAEGKKGPANLPSKM